MMKMTASNRLRFVEREERMYYEENIARVTYKKVLQQYWYVTGTREEFWDKHGEWRDVPVEAE